ncbi:hypothetical protein [Acrocarpospora catenulata]|uniref:hypothetical protein n=1 Tax=Acrocarpospora catenulata TaxID=2836182 RepID=UPI001BD98F36|nr:hypothetical protein [Acrocarpospora catenulata]
MSVALLAGPAVLTALLVTLRPERPVLPYGRMLAWSALLVVAMLVKVFVLESMEYEAEALIFVPPLAVIAIAAGHTARTATGRRMILLAAAPVVLACGYHLLYVIVMTGFGWLGLLIPAVIVILRARGRAPRDSLTPTGAEVAAAPRPSRWVAEGGFRGSHLPRPGRPVGHRRADLSEGAAAPHD